MQAVYLDRSETTDSRWKALVAERLKTAKTFEIHCWNEETEWIQRRDHAFKLLYDHAKSVGGLVSGEHGIGYVKKPYMRESLGDNVLDLMRGIKKVFDPNSIMNPDKLFDLED